MGLHLQNEVYCVWQVVNTPTIILNNPVFKGLETIYQDLQLFTGTVQACSERITLITLFCNLICQIYVEFSPSVFILTPLIQHRNSVSVVTIVTTLRAGESVVLISVGEGKFWILQKVQTSPEAQQTSYSMGTVGYFPEDKTTGVWGWSLLHIVMRSWMCVELYLHSRCMPSWLPYGHLYLQQSTLVIFLKNLFQLLENSCRCYNLCGTNFEISCDLFRRRVFGINELR